MARDDDDDDDRDRVIRTLGDAADGRWVKVVGTVVACEGELLVAPLTGRRCVAFDAAIFQYVLESHPTLDTELYGNGQLLSRSLRAVPFILEDAAGRALVDPRGAFVRLAHDHQQGGPGERIQHLVVADPSFLPKTRAHEDKRYLEGVLEVGAEVLVSGLAQTTKVGEASLYRASADARVRITGSADRPADVTNHREEVVKAGGARARRLPTADEGAGGRRTRQHVSGRRIIVPDD